MPCHTLIEGWHARSNLLRCVSVILVLSLWLLIISIISHSWAVTDDGIHVGVFSYLIRNDVKVPENAVPFLYAILAVISLIVLICDVTLDLLFTTKNFYLVIPTLIVFSFIAGCMTSVIVILWLIGHLHTTYHIYWSFGLASMSAILDYVAFTLCAVEFRIRGGQPTPHWDSIERLATESLESEALTSREEMLGETNV